MACITLRRVISPTLLSIFSTSLAHGSKRTFKFTGALMPTPEEMAQIREELHINLKPASCRPVRGTVHSNAEIRKKRSALFTQEKEEQKRKIGRIEKIEVQFQGQPEDVTMYMNKGISTPYDCARHLSEMILKRSVVAEVNGEIHDMHQPLTENCTLRLLHFYDNAPHPCNKAFWKSCSFMLGAAMEKAFRDDHPVYLYSFPVPKIRSGSFVYDIDLKMDEWNPSVSELRILSSYMIRLSRAALPFERLEVNTQIAQKMFEDNPYKYEQIPQIAENSQTGETVTLYRIGDHIDISRGPLISNTNQLGRCTVASVYEINTDYGVLFRFQGVALPAGFILNHYAYGLLEARARKLNTEWLPGIPKDSESEAQSEGSILF